MLSDIGGSIKVANNTGEPMILTVDRSNYGAALVAVHDATLRRKVRQRERQRECERERSF